MITMKMNVIDSTIFTIFPIFSLNLSFSLETHTLRSKQFETTVKGVIGLY